MRKIKFMTLILLFFTMYYVLPVMAGGSDSLTMTLGTTQRLYCGLHYDDGYNKTWVSSDPSIVSVVSNNGAYCNIELKSLGACKLYFSTKYKKYEIIDYLYGYPIFGYREYVDDFTYYITVTKTGTPEPGNVYIRDSLYLKPGDYCNLSVDVKSTEGKLMRNYSQLSWYSSDMTVATVNQIGVVTAWNNGNAVITAITPEGIKGNCTVTVDSPKGYTTISTTQQLSNIRNNLNGKYILTNNIVFSDSDFESGGKFYNGGAGWSPIDGFMGTLDGNGFYIENLECKAKNAGLFTGLKGKLCNLEIKDSNISATDCAGGLFATGDGFELINCKSTGNTITGNYAGGIGGKSNNYGFYSMCTNTSTVKGYASSGGITGYGSFGVIFLLCTNKGAVSTTSVGDVGGILGKGGNLCSLKYCANEGTISGISNTGGLVGLSGVGSEIYTSYNIGKVIGNGTSANIGGIVGRIYTTYIADCYNEGALELNSGKSGLMGGIVGNVTNISYTTGDNALMLLNCISNGTLNFTGNGLPKIGGIASTITGSSMLSTQIVAKNCYYLSTLCQTGIAWVKYGNTDKILPLTATQMKTSSSFPGLDFSTVWVINSGDTYPRLRFQSEASNIGVIGLPGSVEATSTGYDNIKLSWTAASDASGYEIYRATSSSGTYTFVSATSYTSYTNTGLDAGTTYYYKIRAYNNIGTTKVYGGYSAIVNTKTRI